MKHIADPIHKTIILNDLEERIVDTRSFQRLRNVKQLGLVHYVFPGGDYSRFAHSLGVLHVASRMLEILSSMTDDKLTEDETRLYRVAALLHDIGHFPFSHAMEHAVGDYYKNRMTIPSGSVATAASSTASEDDGGPSATHLTAGHLVMRWDDELSNILRDEGITHQDVYNVFARADPEMKFAQVVSSDLDADRIDFLLRNAHHTGLPYGGVDIDYLLSQITTDSLGRLSLTEKALKTADHFLLGRYFDYQQVIYHKTVVAFEEVLQRVLFYLIEGSDGDVGGTEKWVTEAVKNGKWADYDDGFLIEKIKELHSQTTDSVIRALTGSILNRVPPRLVASYEVLAATGSLSDRETHRRIVRGLSDERLAEWADKFSIDKNLWIRWTPSPKSLTSIGSQVPIDSVLEGSGREADMYEQSVRIADAQEDAGSRAIISHQSSLMSVLSNYQLYTVRLYVLLPEGKEDLRAAIHDTVLHDVPPMH